jgi:hypothetical protein
MARDYIANPPTLKELYPEATQEELLEIGEQIDVYLEECYRSTGVSPSL